MFWNEFYKSSEKFLFPDCEKEYFLFTVYKKLLSLQLSNETVYYYKNEGWLQYLRFRAIGDIKRYSTQNRLNTAFWNNILNYLNKNNQWILYTDVIHELIELENIELLNSQFDKFYGIYQRSKHLPSRENVRCFSGSFLGLRGASRKYLNELPIPSSRWDKLI